MSDTAQRVIRKKSGGDTAVDGLLAGILAGLGMAAYLILSGLLSGTSPAIILGRFDPTMDGGWLVGSAAHLAVSGIYGVGFALLFAIGSALAGFAAALRLAVGTGLWAGFGGAGARRAAACSRIGDAGN